MKRGIGIAMLFCISLKGFAGEPTRSLGLTSSDYNWSDVESLVEPYLDGALFTALVMQGQSSEYRTATAAAMVLQYDILLPEVIETTLNALVKADCS